MICVERPSNFGSGSCVTACEVVNIGIASNSETYPWPRRINGCGGSGRIRTDIPGTYGQTLRVLKLPSSSWHLRNILRSPVCCSGSLTAWTPSVRALYFWGWILGSVVTTLILIPRGTQSRSRSKRYVTGLQTGKENDGEKCPINRLCAIE